MVERWLWDLDNVTQLCVATLPPERGSALAKFIRHAAEKDIRFASSHQPSTLPGTVDYNRLPKDLRTRIESVLHLVSDLPIPIESRGIFTSTRFDGPWDKDLPPSFSQWRARLSFIGDQL